MTAVQVGVKRKHFKLICELGIEFRFCSCKEESRNSVALPKLCWIMQNRVVSLTRDCIQISFGPCNLTVVPFLLTAKARIQLQPEIWSNSITQLYSVTSITVELQLLPLQQNKPQNCVSDFFFFPQPKHCVFYKFRIKGVFVSK